MRRMLRSASFLVAGGTAIGSGRGERLAPVLARGTFHWVFALAEGGLSTPTVFAEIDRLRAGRDIPEPSPTPELMGALRSGDPTQLALHLRNDLQEAAIALRPGLQEVIDDGLEFGALAGIVSGSGPTVAFLARDHETALDLAVALTASGAVLYGGLAYPELAAHLKETRGQAEVHGARFILDAGFGRLELA